MIYAATATFICVVIRAATRSTRSLKVVLQNAHFPLPQQHFQLCVKETCGVCFGVFVCVRARVDVRAAVNVQLHNVAVVGKVVRAATRRTRSLKVVLQNAQFPQPQRQCEVARARRRARRAITSIHVFGACHNMLPFIISGIHYFIPRAP